jgi:hypothetical protein
VLLPHLGPLKTESQNFRIVALLASEHGDRTAAIAALQDAAHIGQLLSDEPALISQLVRVTCLNLAVDGVEQFLSRQRLTADELEQLRVFLEKLNLQGVARSALVNERPFCLSGFDLKMIASAATNAPPSDDLLTPEQSARAIAIGVGVMKSTGFLDPDRRLMLETFKEAIELAGEQTAESLEKLDELSEKVEVKAHKFPPKIICSMMLPALGRVVTRFAFFEAHRRAALTALAVERYSLEHSGQLPETLAEIVPAYLSAIPSDPFDGKALRFRKFERGFVVYSVGQDREDNGGKERVKSSPKQTDVTFIVER